MFKKLIFIFAFFISLIITSCSPEHSNIILSEFGNDSKVTMGEFEKVYAKNAGSYDAAKNDSIQKYKNFLDLYTNFKMKLRDAQVRGLDEDPKLQDELLDYKKKVGVSYLLEKQIVEPGVKDLYNKRKWELRISHIMIVPDTSGDEAAKKLANSVLDSIQKGADFAKMAEKYSNDNFSKTNGGDIFYITAGLLPTEFEDAAYTLDSGKVYPGVVKTKYGYHIIKVTDKRVRVPQIKASHILIDFKNDAGQIDSVAARARIDSILTKAKSDSDFAKLAEEYSEDTGSKAKGGDLGFFQRRTTVKEFDEAAFNLKNVGDISDVVKTQFGYHIIKLMEKKPYPTYAEDKEELTNLFKKQSYQTVYDNYIDSLRTKYNYKLNDETFNAVLNGSDSLKVGGDHPKMDELKDKSLFSYANKNIKVEEFFPKMSADQDFVNKQLNSDLLKKAINKISGDYLLEEEALNLEKKDSVFADLMEDYKNGIYIFKLQEDEVWNKINVDTTDLYDFYKKTKEKYVWQDRVDFSEIFSKSDSLINHYYSLLQNGESFDSVAAKYTERPGYKEKAGNFGLQDAKQTQLASEAEKLTNPGDYSKPFKNSGGYSIVRLNAKDPSHEKSFEEAKPEVSGAYQEDQSKKLEDNYVENLKKIYKPVFYYDELSKAYKTE